MDQLSAVTQLLPRALTVQCQRQTKDDFLLSFDDTHFLLIRIDDVAGELAVSLSNSQAKGGVPIAPTYDPAEFTTASLEAGTATAALAARRLSRSQSLQARLAQAPHFVAPLRKRRGGMSPFEGRIAVGRTANNDLVLCEATVSKFHAWFACGADRRFYLIDAGSKNFTTVNGTPLVPQSATLIEPGDEIKFGRVETTLCHPEAIWTMLTKEGPSA
jgi:hypothetical protein